MTGGHPSEGWDGRGSLSLDLDRELDRRARAALTRLVEPPSPPLVRLVDAWGATEVLQRIAADDDTFSASVSAPDEAVGRRKRWRQRLGSVDVDRDLALAARVGARYVVPGDPEWPPQVDVLGDARPLGLWVRGVAPAVLDVRRTVSVVGARACTAYGEHVASTLAAGLGERGVLVVSGGAFGIDAAAHRGALVVGAPTVAVLACGVDLAYPRAHEALLQRIGAEGLVVSEYAPGTPVTRGRFLDRNRLLAALAAGTVLVEAGLRSGARSTVGHARRLQRAVMVVPGPVTSPASAGCHVELRRGDAVLVTDAAEVLDVVGELGEDAAPDKRDEHRGRLDRLDATGMRVWDAMPLASAIDVDALAAGSGLTVPELLGRLAEMAAIGLVEPAPGGWRRRRER